MSKCCIVYYFASHIFGEKRNTHVVKIMKLQSPAQPNIGNRRNQKLRLVFRAGLRWVLLMLQH